MFIFVKDSFISYAYVCVFIFNIISIDIFFNVDYKSIISFWRSHVVFEL